MAADKCAAILVPAHKVTVGTSRHSVRTSNVILKFQFFCLEVLQKFAYVNGCHALSLRIYIFKLAQLL